MFSCLQNQERFRSYRYLNSVPINEWVPSFKQKYIKSKKPDFKGLTSSCGNHKWNSKIGRLNSQFKYLIKYHKISAYISGPFKRTPYNHFHVDIEIRKDLSEYLTDPYYVHYDIMIKKKKYKYLLANKGVFGGIKPWYWKSRGKRFVIVKVGLPGHYSLALIDRKKKRIEYFDSCGNHPDTTFYSGHRKRYKRTCVTKITKTYHEYEINILKQVLDKFCIDPDTGKSFEFILVNDRYLQKNKNDLYCQTWIYYYLYKRLIEKKSIIEIIENLYELDKKKEDYCLKHIISFSEFILYLKNQR